MIKVINNLFMLNTEHTTYAFRISEDHLIEHLHYGALLPVPVQGDDTERALMHKVSHDKGTTINYRKESPLTIEDLPLEVSSYGKGDFREPMLVLSYADGSRTSDFIYKSHEISNDLAEIPHLPSAVAADDDPVSQLTLHLTERSKGVRLDLIYTVYPETDVITRRAVLINDTEEKVTIERLLSTQVDL
ncbi:MAG: alpha-galactosidase, partial [Lachnospiraceae bacterium]|nr:alpha-galactosidase [Lachnospiraceae bacterium]